MSAPVSGSAGEKPVHGKEGWMMKLKKFFITIKNLVIICGGILAIIFLTEKYYIGKYGNNEIFFIGNDLFVIQALAFPVFYWLMRYYWFWNGAFYEGDGRGICSNLPVKKKAVRTAAALAVFLSVQVLSVQFYTKITMEGAQLHRFTSVKDYTWEDVEYYTLDKHFFDSTLSMKLVMKDGQKLEMLPGVEMANSKAYIDRFREEEFVLWLNRELIERNKPLRIDDEEKLMKKLNDSYWQEIAEQIIEEYGRDKIREGNGNGHMTEAGA